MYHKLLGLVCFLLIGFGSSLPASAAQPSKPLEEGEIVSSKDCRRCHKDIHDMWSESMHSHAVSDPIFSAAYMEAYLRTKGEAKKLCLGCHAPAMLINGDEDMENDVTAEGVTCHFCHSIKDVNLDAAIDSGERFDLDVGKTMFGPNGNGGNQKYHESALSKIYGESKFCAGCHEYKANGINIMETYTEWLKGPYPSKGVHCQDCHMKRQGIGKSGKKVFSHYLAGGHSALQLKKAIDISITGVKRGKDRITVFMDLENVGSGHMVPTGIPSRKLILTCKIILANNVTRTRSIKYEKVIFDANGKELLDDSDIMAGFGSQIVKDNRLAPLERRKEKFVFFIEPKGEILVSVKVEYLYRPKVLEETEMRIEMGNADMAFQP